MPKQCTLQPLEPLPESAYALTATGDAMAPTIACGDRLTFLPDAEPANGDVVHARLRDGREVIARYYAGSDVLLFFDNQGFDPVAVNPREVIWLAVLAEVRRRTHTGIVRVSG